MTHHCISVFRIATINNNITSLEQFHLEKNMEHARKYTIQQFILDNTTFFFSTLERFSNIVRHSFILQVSESDCSTAATQK